MRTRWIAAPLPALVAIAGLGSCGRPERRNLEVVCSVIIYRDSVKDVRRDDVPLFLSCAVAPIGFGDDTAAVGSGRRPRMLCVPLAGFERPVWNCSEHLAVRAVP